MAGSSPPRALSGKVDATFPVRKRDQQNLERFQEKWMPLFRFETAVKQKSGVQSAFSLKA
jgi:hypothetical protein